MAKGYMWRMEGRVEKWTAMLYDDTVITIIERGGVPTVNLMTFILPEVAYDAVMQMTDTVENRGLELYRVYGCPDSPMLRERVTMARWEYDRDPLGAEEAVLRVSAHIVGNSTILYPTHWF